MKLTETEANETEENDDNDYNGNETNQVGSGEPTGLNNVTFLAKTTAVMNHRIDFLKSRTTVKLTSAFCVIIFGQPSGQSSANSSRNGTHALLLLEQMIENDAKLVTTTALA